MHPRSGTARGTKKGLRYQQHPTLAPWHGQGAGTPSRVRVRTVGHRAGQVLVRAEALGGRRPARSHALCPRRFLSPGTHAPSRPLYAQQKGGTSVTICIANPAAPAASSEGPSILPAPASPAHIRRRCGSLPFSPRWLPPAARTHPGMPDGRSPTPRAGGGCRASPRLLNQTQRALPDSARARSGITHRQACSGQRRA